MNKGRGFAAFALSTTTIISLTPTASGDGKFQTDKNVCFYYNSDLQDAKVDLDDCWVYNHTNFKFIGPGNGVSIMLKHNAASVQNWQHETGSSPTKTPTCRVLVRK